MTKGIPTRRDKDPELILRAIDEALKAIQAKPFTGGSHSNEIVTPSAANTDFLVPHKLQRVPQGFIQTSTNAASVIYLSPNPPSDGTKFLNFRCNVASAKIKLFIF